MLGAVLSLVRRLGGGAARAVRRLCRGQAAAERARLRRPAALLGADDGEPALASRGRRPLRPCAGRRISGHQPPAGLDPAGAEAGRPRPHRGRRRRAVDLFVPRRDRAQHPRLSRPVHARRPTIVTLERNYRSTQPILAAANARDRLWPASASPRTCGPTARRRQRPQLVTVARRGRRRRATSSSACWRTARPASPLKQQAVLFRASHHSGAARGRADPAQHSVRQVRRAEVSRGRARQGRAGAAALGGEPARPRRGLPRAAAAAGRRAGDRRPRCSTPWPTPPIRSAR